MYLKELKEANEKQNEKNNIKFVLKYTNLFYKELSANVQN